MINKLLPAIFSSFLLLSGCQKIGYVSSNKMLQNYRGALAEHEVFVAKTQIWQHRVDSLDGVLIKLNKYTNDNNGAKEQQILRYRDAVQRLAQQENQRVTGTVLDEMNAYLKQYGKEKGYTFIFGATDTGNIVYAAEGTDITDDVLKGLNEQYNKQHPTSH